MNGEQITCIVINKADPVNTCRQNTVLVENEKIFPVSTRLDMFSLDILSL